MKKLILPIVLALVITAFGASVALADGGQYITDRLERQRTVNQTTVVNTSKDVAKSGNVFKCYIQKSKDATDNSKSENPASGTIKMQAECNSAK